MRFSEQFHRDDADFMEQTMRFVHDSLTAIKIGKKEIVRTELLCEETVAQLAAHADAGSSLLVTIRKKTGVADILLRMRGEAFDIRSDATLADAGQEADDSLDAIRAIVLRAYGEHFKYSNKNHVNRVRIIAVKSNPSLYATLLAIACGLLTGLALKYLLPEAASAGVCDYVLQPVKTVFMNALNMIIAPVVFLSIVTCFSQFDNIAEFGKAGTKIMGMYLLTTVLAICVSFCLASLLQPGAFGFALSEGGSAAAETGGEAYALSVTDTLVRVVPSNFLEPFLMNDTMQLIFLAVIVGVALGKIGSYATMLKDLFDSLNSIFLTITSMIAGFIPLIVFCTITLTVVQLKPSALTSLLGAFGVQFLSTLCMIGVYALLILVLAGLNPLTFLQKARLGMMTGFTTCSSVASMPVNIRVCTEKLGIAPKLANFSIPLGATVNMDGTCIFLTGIGLFLARAYGVEVDSSMYVSAFLTIVLLSLGAPGVPGSGLVALGIVLQVLNVPVEAVGLTLAISPFLDMINTTSNITGDLAATLIVAKSEDLLDRQRYNKKSAVL